MAPRSLLALLLPALAVALRKRRSVGKNKGDSTADVFDFDDSWGTFSKQPTGPTGQNLTAQWSPCPFGMCWDSWGAYRHPQTPGVGGIGNNGCRIWPVSCPGDSNAMDCVFGPCPKHFGSPACVSSGSCGSYCDYQHAGSCSYSGPREPERWHSWMSQFPQRPLNKLLMPEAHHYLAKLGGLDFENPVEASNEILEQLAPFLSLPGMGDLMRVAYASLLPMFASCQSSGTTRLLNSGVRSLDIRPYLSSTYNQLHDSHGGRGVLVEPALAEVAAFVRAHRSEIVFVSLKNILHGTGSCLDCRDAASTFAAINAAVQRHFGECGGGILICNVDVTKTVGELLQGGNVIVMTNSWEVYTGSGNPQRVHWMDGLYAAPWYNKHNLWELQSSMLADGGLQELSRGNTTLISHQWILTPTADDYVGAISSRFTGNWQDRANRHGCQSLACLAEVASAIEFKTFFPSIRARYARSNFLMLDFADRPGAMDFIMEYNNDLNTQRTATVSFGGWSSYTFTHPQGHAMVGLGVTWSGTCLSDCDLDGPALQRMSTLYRRLDHGETDESYVSTDAYPHSSHREIQCLGERFVSGLYMNLAGTCNGKCDADGPAIQRLGLICSAPATTNVEAFSNFTKDVENVTKNIGNVTKNVVNVASGGSSSVVVRMPFWPYHWHMVYARCPAGTFVTSFTVVTGGTCLGRCDHDGPKFREFLLTCTSGP